MGLSSYTPTGVIAHTTSVDFSKRGISQPVHIVQYDDCLPILAVNIYNNGQLYPIPTDMNVSIRLGKPDKTFVYNKALGCDSTRTIVYFEITQQMTIFDGEFYPVIELLRNGKVANSSKIYIVVDKNPIQQDYIESSTEFKELTEYRDEALAAAKEAKSAASNVSSFASTASSSAEAAKDSATKAAESASIANTAVDTVTNLSDTIKRQITSINESVQTATTKASEANTSATNAAESELNAKKSADEATKSVQTATTKASEANTSATNAAESELNAKKSADEATKSVQTATTKASEASTSATNAAESAASALESETNAATSATAANTSATNAEDSATISKSWATGGTGAREDEDTNNSKWYSEKAKEYSDKAESIAGGHFIPLSDKGIAGGVATLNKDLAVSKAVADSAGNNIQTTYATKNSVEESMSNLSNIYANKTDTQEALKNITDKLGNIGDEKYIPINEKGVAGGVAVLDENGAVSKTVSDDKGNKISDTYATKRSLDTKTDKRETYINVFTPAMEPGQEITNSGITCTYLDFIGAFKFEGTAEETVTFTIGKDYVASTNNEYSLSGYYQKSPSDSSYYMTWDSYGNVPEDGLRAVKKSTNNDITVTIVKGYECNVAVYPILTTAVGITSDDYVKPIEYGSTINEVVRGLYDNKLNKDEYVRVDVDYELDPDSINPIANAPITEAINNNNKQTTVNLLNPTLQNKTYNGIECTNNGDGTYTFNGTASTSVTLLFCNDFKLNAGKYKLCGRPNTNNTTYVVDYYDNVNHPGVVKDKGDGCIVNIAKEYTINNVAIIIDANATLNNVIIKPMLTTNLNATYDDFVSYTGNTGQLNSDVAEIRKEYATKTDIPKSLPANGGDADTVNGHTVKSDVPENAVFTDTTYTLPVASETQLGGVKTGSNIKNDNGVISISKENVVAALGYTPAQGTGAVSGVKGSAESSYRTGNVNITAENVRAANKIVFDSATNYLKLYSGSTLLSNISLKTQTIATWENGTDAQIAEMLTAHYKGQIKVSDYWSVGDTRKVALSTGELVELVIIGFDADTLTNSINEKTRAAVTWQQKNCLATKQAMSSSSSEYKWSRANLRTWLQNTYYGYLPTKFKSLIKTVNKKSSHTLSTPNPGATPEVYDSQDTIFIPSYGELFSSNVATLDRTTVYEFYKVASNTSKNIDYWTRTGYVYATTSNIYYGFYGSDKKEHSTAYASGVAPAGCL